MAWIFGIFSVGQARGACYGTTRDKRIITINVGNPAEANTLIAKGRIIKTGRRLSVVAADVFAVQNNAETLIAVLQGTMVPVSG